MKTDNRLALVTGLTLWLNAAASAQVYDWTTIAGSAGNAGTANGTNLAARFRDPRNLVLDDQYLVIADSGNDDFRTLTERSGDWVSATPAGSAGDPGAADGTNNAARLKNPCGLARDGGGNFFFADCDNHSVRRIARHGTNWIVTTIAGKAGSSGSLNGTNGAARFRSPQGLAVDSGVLYVADSGNNTVRKVEPDGTNWVVTTIAGQAGSAGSADGTNSAARFDNPRGILADGGGGLYVSDFDTHIVRHLTPDGQDWIVTTMAGQAGSSGSADGPSRSARFNNPRGMSLDPLGNIILANAGGAHDSEAGPRRNQLGGDHDWRAGRQRRVCRRHQQRGQIQLAVGCDRRQSGQPLRRRCGEPHDPAGNRLIRQVETLGHHSTVRESGGAASRQLMPERAAQRTGRRDRLDRLTPLAITLVAVGSLRGRWRRLATPPSH